MKRIATILLLLIILVFNFSFSGCKKANEIPTVSGTIDGVPAVTLYGSSGNATDYIFIVFSNTNTHKLLCYQGINYVYGNTSSSNNVSIITSSSAIVRATIDTVSSNTVLKILTYPSIFSSTQYTSR